MANNVLFLKDFEIKANQSYFFDNNIWMYLFCPLANFNDKKQQSVSRFFELLLNSNASIIVNSLILSEFSNAYLRLDYEFWKKEMNSSSNDFKKDYFNTERALEIRNVIAAIIKNKILKFSDKYPDSFNALDFSQIFEVYKTLDYNDSIIYTMCKMNKWVLVSDDSDFSSFKDITIIKP